MIGTHSGEVNRQTVRVICKPRHSLWSVWLICGDRHGKTSAEAAEGETRFRWIVHDREDVAQARSPSG